MKLLKEFEWTKVDPEWPVYARQAVRAIVIRNGRIALVKCGTEGYYKFPGGGIEPEETQAQALIREMLEETGLCIIPTSIQAFGRIRERRESYINPGTCFLQDSWYYLAAVDGSRTEPKLANYEQELDYHLEWAAIEAARETNLQLGNPETRSFLLREAFVLDLLRKRDT